MGLSGRPEQVAASKIFWLTLLGGVGLLLPQVSAAQMDLFSQGPERLGQVRGLVAGAGAGLPGVEVMLLGPDKDAGQRIRIDPWTGEFAFEDVAPGHYTLRVEAPGQVGVVPAPIEVQAGVALRVELGPAGQVRVASAPALPPEPDAGVVPDENDDGLASVHGLPVAETRSAVDGISGDQRLGEVPAGSGREAAADDPDDNPDAAERTTGPAHGLGRGRSVGSYAGSDGGVGRGSTREFRVSSGAAGELYTAQSGAAAGVRSFARGRSGDEVLHGAAFWQLRSSALAAYEPLAIATTFQDGLVSTSPIKPHDLLQHFGGSVGGALPGPAGRGGLHGFYGLALERRDFPAISSPADPNFYRLTATQTAVLANRQVTARAVNAGLNYLSSLTGPVDRRADRTAQTGRLAWTRTGWLRELGLAYERVRWTGPAGLIDAPVVARGRASFGDKQGSVDLVLLHADLHWASGWTNEVRLAFARDLQLETPQTRLPQEPGVGPGGLAPEVNVGPNGLVFGTPASLSRRPLPDERRLEGSDLLTWVHGRHVVALGADASFVRERVATGGNAAGTFRYDRVPGARYAGGLVDFLTDYTYNVNAIPNGACPSLTDPVHLFCFQSFSQSFGEDAVSFATEDWSGFAEDLWRVRGRLTVRAGVRYEYTLLPLPQRPNAALDAVFGGTGATSVFPEDRNNVAPRVGVAWEPLGAGRGTLRAGYGMYFGRLPGTTIRAALSDTAMAASLVRVRITPSAVVGCPQVPNQGFGYPCAFLAAPGGIVGATTSAVVFDRGFRLPVIQQASLSFERELGRRTAITVGYVGNIDRQLPTSRDLNIAPATASATYRLQGGTGAPGVRDGETFRLPLYTTRVTPGFGPVTDVVSSVNATYHALEVSGRSRLGQRLAVSGALRWSKAIDFGAALSGTPRTMGQLDPFLNGYDKGLSALNYPWVVHGEMSWRSAFARGPEWVRRVADGWNVALLGSLRSGRPYSFDLFGGTRLPGGHLSLNGAGGAQYLPTVGRNTLRLPMIANVDLRLGRGVRVGRVQIAAQAEAYNLLNHRNVSSVNQRAYSVGAAAGGVIPLVFQDAAGIAAEGLNTLPFGAQTSAGSSLNRERRVQLGVRVIF